MYPYKLCLILNLFRKLFPRKLTAGFDHHHPTDGFELTEPFEDQDEALDFLLEELERDDDTEVLQEYPQNVEPLDFLLQALDNDL